MKKSMFIVNNLCSGVDLQCKMAKLPGVNYPGIGDWLAHYDMADSVENCFIFSCGVPTDFTSVVSCYTRCVTTLREVCTNCYTETLWQATAKFDLLYASLLTAEEWQAFLVWRAAL